MPALAGASCAAARWPWRPQGSPQSGPASWGRLLLVPFLGEARKETRRSGETDKATVLDHVGRKSTRGCGMNIAPILFANYPKDVIASSDEGGGRGYCFGIPLIVCTTSMAQGGLAPSCGINSHFCSNGSASENFISAA